MTSDGAARTLQVEATGAEPGDELVLWFPGESEPVVDGDGIGRADAGRARRGWLVEVEVEAADYRVEVAAAPSGAG